MPHGYSPPDGTPPVPPPASAPPRAPHLGWLTGAQGPMVERCRTFSWESTPLGPPERWPLSLRIALGICLSSRFPMFVWWGKNLINFYNDAYAPMLGRRHPGALGRPAREIWSEIWPVIGPQANAVLTRGEATWHERVPLTLERNGFAEETYFTWSHSPIFEEDGTVGGLICAVTEDTAKVLAERERDRSAQHRQVALDAARMGWWYYDPATGSARYDGRSMEIFGLVGHPHPDEKMRERLHPDDGPRVRARISEALDPALGQPYSSQHRIVLDDGAVRWVEAHGVTTFEGTGAARRAINLVGTVADITERKSYESALARAEERLRVAQQAAHSGAWDWDCVSGEVVWTREYYDLFGFDHDTPGAVDRWLAAVDDRDRESALRAVEVALRPPGRFVAEFRRQHPAKGQRWLSAIGQTTFSGDGRPLRMSGLVLDITDRRSAEDALRQSELRLRSLFEQSAAGIAQTDLQGRLQLINDRYCAIVGYSREELIGKRVHDLTHPDDAGETTRLVATGAATGSDYSMEKRYIRKDGSVVWIAVSAAIIKDVAGTPQSIMGVVVDITARKAAEEALRESEERFRAAFDQSAVGIVLSDLEGNILQVNPAFCALVGRTPQALVGHTSRAFSHPDDVARNVDMIARLKVRERVSSVYEKRYLRPDGAVVSAQVSVSAVHDARGTPAGLIAIVEDITERKRAEAAAARVAEQRRLALDAAQLGWWHYDLATGAVLWDDRAKAIFGVTDPRTAYRDVIALIHPDDRAAVDTAVAAALNPADPRPYAMEYRICPADGRTRWVHAKGQACFDDVGGRRQAVSFVGTIADVTDMRTAQEALRTSEQRFRHLADALPQIVWTASPEGTLDYYNRRWFEYIGRTPDAGDEEIRWDLHIHPEDLPGVYEAWSAALRAGDSYATEFRLRRADGAYRWFLVRAVPQHDAQVAAGAGGAGGTRGGIARWLGTCTDIDEQRRLRIQNEQLLASERHARDDAEAASRAKDRFLAALSHELRTPLTPVAMVAAALEADPRLPAELRDDVAMIRRNVLLETRLIDDLLDLSRVQSGKLRLDLRPVSVHAVIGHALATVGADVHEKRLTVEQTLAARRDVVEADAARLQQVLWNLLKNAVKFTPEGGRIRIATRNDGDRLFIEVQDTGRGIARDVLARVFEPFEQGDPAITRRYGGMGLGLAIAKAVVDLHDGAIQASSEGEGRGATFTVAFPTSSPAAAPAAPEPVSLDTHGDLLRILLVEDHADTGRTLARLLNSSRLTVRWADSLTAALRMVTAERFDLLISDLGLPDGSGHDLMREVARRYAIPGIAMSGYGMEDDVAASRAAGFAEHLIKPLDLTALHAAIRRTTGQLLS